jgi:HlyD family secretion protein
VAPAVVKFEHSRKTVQHLEGGIVRELMVKDGQVVRAGDPLVLIADLQTNAELAVLQDRWLATKARKARLEAEARLDRRIAVPHDLERETAAAEHLSREKLLFEARRQALDEQVVALKGQSRETELQATALQAQVESTQRSIALSDEEVAINDRLAAEGYVHRSRLIGLQRVAADYRTRLGEHRSELSQVQQRKGELGARQAQLRMQFQTQAVDELREVGALLREIENRLQPLRDQVLRQTVRAPVDGAVMAMRPLSPGTTVAPRDALLEVVPDREQLVVHARVAPQDIEHVRVDGTAEVRLHSQSAHAIQPLPARVTFVAPDRRIDEHSGQAWFDVTVVVNESLVSQAAKPQLRAGMGADLYVTTKQRTLLQYLLNPLLLFSQRALREP